MLQISILKLGLGTNAHFLLETILPVLSSLQAIIFLRTPPPQVTEQKFHPPSIHKYRLSVFLSLRFMEYREDTAIDVPDLTTFGGTTNFIK